MSWNRVKVGLIKLTIKRMEAALLEYFLGECFLKVACLIFLMDFLQSSTPLNQAGLEKNYKY